MYDFFSFCTLIRNEKFKSLSKTARLLYIYMLTDSYISGSGEDGFEFPQEVQKEYNLTKGGGQFYTDRQELIDAGFLDIVFNGKGSRQPNIYALSTRWKNQNIKTDGDGCGYLYVVEVDGNYKIGISKNPKQRLGEYTKYAKEPKQIIIKKCYNYRKIEEQLHERYAEKRIRGEWFCLAKQDICDIEAFLEENEDKPS